MKSESVNLKTTNLNKIDEESEEKMTSKFFDKEIPIETGDPTDSEEESFDLKIFPKLYQNLFQINNKSFDTDGLLKSNIYISL